MRGTYFVTSVLSITQIFNLQVVLCLHYVPCVLPRIGTHLPIRPTFARGVDIYQETGFCNIYAFTSIADINTARPHYRAGKPLFMAIYIPSRTSRNRGVISYELSLRPPCTLMHWQFHNYATEYVTIGKETNFLILSRIHTHTYTHTHTHTHTHIFLVGP